MIRNNPFVGAHCNVGARCSVPLHEMHHRRSIRLKGYDYSRPGAYFVTICTHNKECVLGDIIDGNIHLNEFGKVVEEEWLKTFDMRKDLKLDGYVVMPNHFHGIILVEGRGVLQYAPTENVFRSPSGTIGAVVRGFKSSVTKKINMMRSTTGAPVWQRNYYEHIIRDEEELNQVREYIVNNPLQWQFDRENPERRGTLQRARTGILQYAPTNDKWKDFEKKVYGKTKQ